MKEAIKMLPFVSRKELAESLRKNDEIDNPNIYIPKNPQTSVAKAFIKDKYTRVIDCSEWFKFSELDKENRDE